MAAETTVLPVPGGPWMSVSVWVSEAWMARRWAVLSGTNPGGVRTSGLCWFFCGLCGFFCGLCGFVCVGEAVIAVEVSLSVTSLKVICAEGEVVVSGG